MATESIQHSDQVDETLTGEEYALVEQFRALPKSFKEKMKRIGGSSEWTSEKPAKDGDFCYIPAIDKSLMRVVDLADEDKHFLMGQADCLEDSAREMLTEAIGYEGMEVGKIFAVRFMLDAAHACRSALGQIA